VDAYLDIISLRAVHDYSDRPIDDNELERILQAGRAAGSAANRQPWLFVTVTSRDTLDRLAEAVYEPDNLRGCQAAIAVVVRSPNQGFDAGRAAENIMLAAWADGIGSCPNGVRDRERAHAVLGIPEDRYLANIISLGYPKKPWQVADKSPEGILRRIKRKPLSEIVRRI
jgi:nitroreductase